MNQATATQQSPGFLALTLSVIVCLALLINASFKIIQLHGMMFSVHSMLCPLIAGFYLLALLKCSIREQRHLLNISLMSLYAFCIGVYILVNLPAAEYMHDNPVYQIIFDDIPKKFFAVTISFTFSFYLPHLLFFSKSNNTRLSPIQSALLALSGGFSFFFLSFILLFSGSYIHNFHHILVDSMTVTVVILLIISILLFLISRCYPFHPPPIASDKKGVPLYPYLVCFASVIMLICLACEYHLVAFIDQNWVLSASALFFPMTLIISTIIGERWGYPMQMKFSLSLITTQFVFDALLMGIISLPSPDLYNLNPFYNYIMFRRLPAASLALFATFMSNAMLLHYLKQLNMKRPLRILIATVCANSLLCFIDYGLLFGGIYPYDQIINLVANVWHYKLFITLISLPFILKYCRYLEHSSSRAQAKDLPSNGTEPH